MAMIHDSRDIPMIDYSGVYLNPGFKHRITYVKKRITNLQAPYSTCSNENPPMVKASFNYFGGSDYAFNNGWCSTVCAQVFMLVVTIFFLTKTKQIINLNFSQIDILNVVVSIHINGQHDQLFYQVQPKLSMLHSVI